jgi:hypothetical protein
VALFLALNFGEKLRGFDILSIQRQCVFACGGSRLEIASCQRAPRRVAMNHDLPRTTFQQAASLR